VSQARFVPPFRPPIPWLNLPRCFSSFLWCHVFVPLVPPGLESSIPCPCSSFSTCLVCTHLFHPLGLTPPFCSSPAGVLNLFRRPRAMFLYRLPITPIGLFRGPLRNELLNPPALAYSLKQCSGTVWQAERLAMAVLF